MNDETIAGLRRMADGKSAKRLLSIQVGGILALLDEREEAAQRERDSLQIRYQQKKDVLEGICLQVGQWGIQLAITARERDQAVAAMLAAPQGAGE